MSKHRETKRKKALDEQLRQIFRKRKNYNHQRKHNGIPGLHWLVGKKS